jgi:energy-coupling factor transporter transmembrane protein EcfT
LSLRKERIGLNDNYPFIFSYTAGASWVAGIDARVRILTGLIVVVLIAVLLDPVTYLLLTLTIAVGCVVLRLSWIDFRRFLAIFLVMATVTLTLHLLFNRTGYIVIARVMGLPITQQALIAGLLFSWRLALFLMAAICLTKMISPDDFATGVWRVLAPLKKLGCAIDGIGMSLWVAIRFVPAIFAQYHQIVFAQKARGATFDGGLITRARKIGPLLIPVTVAAIRKSDILADALTVRGWGVGAKRTFYGYRPLAGADYVFLMATLIWGGVILWIVS